jgi:hypothetical protein
MRTIAITIVFVVLNGAGFLYRVMTHRQVATAAEVPSAVVPSAASPGSAAA